MILRFHDPMILYIDCFLFSQPFPGRWLLTRGKQCWEKMAGLLFKELCKQSPNSQLVWAVVIEVKRAAVTYISQALGHEHLNSALLSKLPGPREKKNIIILNMHQNYFFFQCLLLPPLGSSWVFKLHWQQQRMPALSCWLSGTSHIPSPQTGSFPCEMGMRLVTWDTLNLPKEKAGKPLGIITAAAPTKNIPSPLHPAHMLYSTWYMDSPGQTHATGCLIYTKLERKVDLLHLCRNTFIPRH